MDTFEVFVHAGLDRKSAAVLSVPVEKGPLSLSDLNRETHINRPALYALIPRLVDSGLISLEKRNKRTLYRAESPTRLLERYRQERTDVEEKLSEIAATYARGTHEKPVIQYFEGKRGVTFVFDDIARTVPKNGIFYRYSSRTGDEKEFHDTFYAQTRDAKKLERMVITSEEKANRKSKKLDRSVKAIPKDFDLFADNVSLVIYGDKTAYVDYDSKTSFIVESAKIARFQEKLFRLLYRKL